MDSHIAGVLLLVFDRAAHPQTHALFQLNGVDPGWSPCVPWRLVNGARADESLLSGLIVAIFRNTQWFQETCLSLWGNRPSFYWYPRLHDLFPTWLLRITCLHWLRQYWMLNIIIHQSQNSSNSGFGFRWGWPYGKANVLWRHTSHVLFWHYY